LVSADSLARLDRGDCVPGVPEIRIRTRNNAPVRADGDYVLYWMTAFRRLRWNFALDRAIELAREFKRPLLVLEALRCDYPWASDRIHRFVLEGMAENRKELADSGVAYFAYVEPAIGAGKGLLEALGKHACVVVTDDFPAFFIPRMIESAARKLGARLESVDSNGLLPLRAAGAAYPTAYAFRRFLQKQLPNYLAEFPHAHPLARLDLPRLTALPRKIAEQWPPASSDILQADGPLAALPIDHHVGAADIRGGERAAQAALRNFLAEKLAEYSDERNEPEKDATSGLSPYLHFGQISSHEIFHDLMAQEQWYDTKLSVRSKGNREGWWGVRAPAEAFLDQLVTWREVGFNAAAHLPAYDSYGTLPEWALRTLKKHARDDRTWTYSLGDFAGARTHDPLWNAAQRQLLRDGRLHNYLRMLWGKKILEWSATPEEALEIMIELNNRYALDGRDPNSYSGIFWCLGRYDRPWGPERPVFGTVRYMSSENTARKIRVKGYLKKYGSTNELFA
jgi:deoxyribodipyrimidine photo-lyase